MDARLYVVANVALALSFVSLALAMVAYSRAGARDDVAVIRMKQRLLAGEVSCWIRSGLDDSLVRVIRAQVRLAELGRSASAGLRESIDALGRQLAEMKQQAEEGLARLETGVSAGARATQEGLARRVRRLEGSIQVLAARDEIGAAERLADSHEFVRAEDLLEDAVARVREVRMRLADEVSDDAAFATVLEALQDAVRSIRARAEDHKRRIDTVLSASDSLLASLDVPREPAVA
jgi:hypothetical protein